MIAADLRLPFCKWCQLEFDPEDSDAQENEIFCSDTCEQKSLVAEEYDDYEEKPTFEEEE